jgi:K+-transporting ATPase KdpF subunit
MSFMSWVGLILAVGLGVYLFIALLLPEKFE